jgi:Zn finger protein HypA/HybF involved in hydrogenase expression
MLELCKCPDCTKPFMPIQTNPKIEGPGFDCCPKCGKQTFKVEKDKGINAVD